MPKAAWAGRGAARSARLRARMPRTALASMREGRIMPRSSARRPRSLGFCAIKALLADLMDSASAHAEYADVRHIRSLERSLATRNGELDEVESYDEQGLGVRVRVGGAWGFAATRETTRD